MTFEVVQLNVRHYVGSNGCPTNVLQVQFNFPALLHPDSRNEKGDAQDRQ